MHGSYFTLLLLPQDPLPDWMACVVHPQIRSACMIVKPVMADLELLKGETPAQTLLEVVLHCLAVDNGSQGARCWPGKDLASLLLTLCTALQALQKLPCNLLLELQAGLHLCEAWGAKQEAGADQQLLKATSTSYALACLRCFRAGWLNQVLTSSCHFFLKCLLGITLL